MVLLYSGCLMICQAILKDKVDDFVIGIVIVIKIDDFVVKMEYEWIHLKNEWTFLSYV